jgi:hypothetical protein
MYVKQMSENSTAKSSFVYDTVSISRAYSIEPHLLYKVQNGQ